MPKVHQCGTCGRTFAKAGKLTQHLRIHTGERPYACSHSGCTKRYSRRDHLTRHELSHSDAPKKYRCKREGCDKSFGTRQKLERHEAVHNKAKPFVCTECGESFGKKWMIARHAAEHDGREAPYPCEEEGCTKSFVRPSALLRHVQKVHRKGSKLYACGDPKCSTFLFKTMSDLKRHMMIVHSKMKKWECDQCGLRVRNKSRLEKHKETHEKSFADRLEFRCDVPDCAKAYTRKSNLNAHKRAAHSDAKIRCESCLTTFCHKQSLQRHSRVCLGKRSRDDEAAYSASAPLSVAKRSRPTGKSRRELHGNNLLQHPYDFLSSICGEVPAAVT